MHSIAELCNEIVSHASNLGIQTPLALCPGISKKNVASATSGLPFAIPAALVELYIWRNGTQSAAKPLVDFFPGYAFEPIHDSIQIYSQLVEFPDWQYDWMPIFRSGGADFYCAKCGPTALHDTPIVNVANELPPFEEFPSLVVMLQVLVACYNKKIFYLDKTGGFTKHDSKYRREVQEHGGSAR